MKLSLQVLLALTRGGSRDQVLDQEGPCHAGWAAREQAVLFRPAIQTCASS